ncbi:MAG: Gfo/Idh/MocA family oxidoreductase [Candidatus Hydrogenedentes bacterium]|nr:Gfo/Idh/MocA family oxidoreductase [Candidatus Hydrogenedentota bacterium]
MDKKSDVSRRDFIRGAAKGAAGVAAATSAARTAQASAYKSILPHTCIGANEMIRTGHIGTGIMGRGNLRFVLERDDMLPIAVCDIYAKHKMQAASMAGAKNEQVTAHHHYEEVIENKDVDAVVISTSDHWHALPAIQACDAGKAVYCEKPMTTTIEEARHVLDAAKRNNTIFQGGTLQRSGNVLQEGVQLIREGYLGDVFRVETWYHDDSLPPGLGTPPDEDPPEGCDWELHQGWVERVPFNKNRWLYSFRFFFDYAGGRLTDWGVHLVDIAMWALGEDKKPKSVATQGGKYVIRDNRTVPDTFDALWEFDGYTISFSHRACNAYPEAKGSSHGMVFHGWKATMVMSRAGYQVFPQERKKKSGETVAVCEAKEARQTEDLYRAHWANFAESIRQGTQPVSHAEALFNSTVTCHMATCAHIAGDKLAWDPAAERFVGDSEAAKKANAWAYRPYQNGYKLI